MRCYSLRDVSAHYFASVVRDRAISLTGSRRLGVPLRIKTMLTKNCPELISRLILFGNWLPSLWRPFSFASPDFSGFAFCTLNYSECKNMCKAFCSLFLHNRFATHNARVDASDTSCVKAQVRTHNLLKIINMRQKAHKGPIERRKPQRGVAYRI